MAENDELQDDYSRFVDDSDYEIVTDDETGHFKYALKDEQPVRTLKVLRPYEASVLHKKKMFDDQFDQVMKLLDSKDKFESEAEIDALIHKIHQLGTLKKLEEKPIFDPKNRLSKREKAALQRFKNRIEESVVSRQEFKTKRKFNQIKDLKPSVSYIYFS